MQQLSPQDAVFLSMETPELPAHIGGLVFLQPTEGHPFDFETFVEFVRARLGPVERFSWRLQEVPLAVDRPYWVTTPDFDPADHLHCLRIPDYSPEGLGKLAGRIFERPMDRSRPLWDMVLIEGLPGDRSAVLWRMHHCLMDGASGANLSEQLFDLSPDAVRPPSAVQDSAKAGKRVSGARVYANALRNSAELPVKQSRFISRAIKGLLQKRKESAGPDAEEAEASLAPPALWNGVVGPHRGLAWTSVSLDDVKKLKQTLGVTVNDILLGITGGAIRDYHEVRDALPDESMRASVPCSLRAADDKAMGNKVSELPVHWATDEADPIDRVLAINESTKRAKKAARNGDAFDMIGMMSESLIPAALNILIRGAAMGGTRMPLPTNAVVSNVPMAPVPLYCAGALIERVIPISLLGPTQGVNITLLSYKGELHFGLVHDPNLLADPWELAGRIPKALQALQQAVDQKLQTDPGE